MSRNETHDGHSQEHDAPADCDDGSGESLGSQSGDETSTDFVQLNSADDSMDFPSYDEMDSDLTQTGSNCVAFELGTVDGFVKPSCNHEVDISRIGEEDHVTLYNRGKEFEQREQLEMALNSYISAVDKMSQGTGQAYRELPDCLHRISNIYFLAEEYDKAVKFAEAEKLYYETALLGTVSPNKSRDTRNDQQSEDIVLIERADEFEKLSKLCLSERKPRLALDYCGKACKLRQRVLGDNHAKTTATLDMFAGIYAEVGRRQYADAVNRATASNEGHSPALEDPLSDSGEESLSEIPEYVTTITRQVRGQGQPKKVVDDVEPAVKQLSGQAKKSPVPPLPLNPTSRKPADSTEQDTSTVSNTSDTDCTLRQRRQTPLGESDHGSQSSPVKVTVTAQLGTATKEAIANPTLEELRSRREKIESEADAEAAVESPPGLKVLVIFFLASCLVTIVVTVLWCRWARTQSCVATHSFLANFSDHAVHIRNKAVLALRSWGIV